MTRLNYAIETIDLSKSYGAVKAVAELSISIPKSGLTSIIGPNGSGKSTLVNLLSGTLPADGGIVVIDGQSLKVVRAHEAPSHGLTRTFQEVRLFDQISVWDNIMIVLTERRLLPSLFERTTPDQARIAQMILTFVGLWDKQQSLAEELSYGQRKLLEMGRAMAMQSQIYLLDEPFAGLFPEMLVRMKAVMGHLRRQGHSVILISHNMDMVRELSDHLIVIDGGRLLAAGDVEEVLARKDVIEAYLGV